VGFCLFWFSIHVKTHPQSITHCTSFSPQQPTAIYSTLFTPSPPPAPEPGCRGGTYHHMQQGGSQPCVLCIVREAGWGGGAAAVQRHAVRACVCALTLDACALYLLPPSAPTTLHSHRGVEAKMIDKPISIRDSYKGSSKLQDQVPLERTQQRG